MTIQTIALKDIDAAAKHNSRSKLEGIEELAEDIRRKGVLQPLVVQEHPEKAGKFILRAGFRRYAALKLNEETETVCNIVDSKVDGRIINLTENLQREDLNSHDFAMAVADLKDSGMTARQISTQLAAARKDETGTSIGNINNLHRLARGLDKRILRAWKDGHEDASTYNLLKYVINEEDQWYAWQVLTGAVVPSPAGPGEGKDPPAGPNEGEQKFKRRRAPEAVKMLDAVDAAQHIAADQKALVREAFDWLMGARETILGIEV